MSTRWSSYIRANRTKLQLQLYIKKLAFHAGGVCVNVGYILKDDITFCAQALFKRDMWLPQLIIHKSDAKLYRAKVLKMQINFEPLFGVYLLFKNRTSLNTQISPVYYASKLFRRTNDVNAWSRSTLIVQSDLQNILQYSRGTESQIKRIWYLRCVCSWWSADDEAGHIWGRSMLLMSEGMEDVGRCLEWRACRRCKPTGACSEQVMILNHLQKRFVCHCFGST